MKKVDKTKKVKKKAFPVRNAKPVGRPSIYEKTLKSAREYMRDWKKLYPEDVIPMQTKMALHCNIHRDTVDKWKNDEKKREFIDIAKKIKEIQKSILISRGLSGDFNASIAKLMLSQHNVVEKTRLESDNKHTITIRSETVGEHND